MKKTLFLKIFCCLLILCLLSGCGPKSSLLAHADDTDGLKKDLAEISLWCHIGYSIENSRGEKLQYLPDSEETGEHIITGEHYKPEGNMKYSGETRDSFKVGWHRFQVPFSQSFTVHEDYLTAAVEQEVFTTEEIKEVDYETESHATFYFEDNMTVFQDTWGDWNKAIHHCNNVVELFGGLSEFTITFRMLKNSLPPALADSYEISGAGKGHVIAAFENGEILTEGMEGNYTVTVNDYFVYEYDETGHLLSTTEE